MKIRKGQVVCDWEPAPNELVLSGSLTDNNSILLLRAAGGHVLETEPCKQIILNAKDVPEIGSIGWGELMSLLGNAYKVSGDVILACLSPQLRTAFGNTSLASVMTAYDTREEAIESCRPRR